MRTVFFPNVLFDNLTEEKVITARSRVDEDAANYYIHVEVPGFSKSDLKILIEDRELKIEGEKKGKFPVSLKKAFNLPDEIEIEKIRAQTKDGVLELVLPKSAALAPKEIPVEEGTTSLFPVEKE